MRQARLTFDQRTLLLALLVGLPASALAFVLLLIGDYPAGLRWTLGLALLVAWIGLAHYLRTLGMPHLYSGVKCGFGRAYVDASRVSSVCAQGVCLALNDFGNYAPFS